MTKLKKYLTITYLLTLCFTLQLVNQVSHADAKTDLGGTITFSGPGGQKLNLPSLKWFITQILSMKNHVKKKKEQ